MSVPATHARVRRRLATFTGRGHDRGAGLVRCALWVLAGQPVIRSTWCHSRVRVAVLRAFGADLAPGVLIRSDVRIHWPWKLRIGRDSWVGVGSWLLNLEPIDIGSDVCVSQGVLLCTGSHHAEDPAFEYDNAPVRVENGAWIAARATVLRGVTVGADAVVGASALVVADVPAGARVVAPAATVR